MAVEAAFPQSGISRVVNYEVKWNEEAISELQDGTAYRTGYGGTILSGSRPEGFAMDDDWGHDATDWDYMELYGGPLGVNVAPGDVAVGQRPRGRSCLDFSPEGCPAAYTKLQITDLPALNKNFDSMKWIEEGVYRSGDQCWLDIYQAVQGLRRVGSVSGPAAQFGTDDWVTTLVCNNAHPDMYEEFPNRSRQWPPASLISVLLKLPMLLVLVGHKLSPEFNLQARISWSLLELKLIQELPESVHQGYIACKYVLKRFLKARRSKKESDDGRNRIGSYHIKTSLLRYLEKTPPSLLTSPFRLFLDLLHELNGYLKVRKLSHYFLANCNLLETVKDDELCIARQVIKEILEDPLNALLTSPTDPQQIYGEVHLDCLVLAFHRILSHPTCEQSWKDFSQLLTRVDERRRQKYTEQREKDEHEDEDCRVSGRTELIGLSETLRHIKRH